MPSLDWIGKKAVMGHNKEVFFLVENECCVQNFPYFSGGAKFIWKKQELV